MAGLRRLFEFVFIYIPLMQILETTDAGFAFIGSDNNYYVCLDNSAINCADEIIPMQLGPLFEHERLIELSL